MEETSPIDIIYRVIVEEHEQVYFGQEEEEGHTFLNFWNGVDNEYPGELVSRLKICQESTRNSTILTVESWDFYFREFKFVKRVEFPRENVEEGYVTVPIWGVEYGGYVVLRRILEVPSFNREQKISEGLLDQDDYWF